MSQAPTHGTTRLAAIIVAAGQGLRAGQPLPKQFALWRGKPVLRHAAESLRAGGVELLCVATPEGADELVAEMLAGLEPFVLVTGGQTRQESVRAALLALELAAPDVVLIHDAARPDCPPEVIERLVEALRDAPGSIPVLPVVDSMISARGSFMEDKADRGALRRVQTPQCFGYQAILAAHRGWQGPLEAGDDAQVAQAAGLTVTLVEGDERLHKLTFATDFLQEAQMIRTGTGFDVHRLGAGEELWLCGVKIAHDRGLVGHSDADVALHALVDAILGAAGEGDIGQHFPPSDPQWRGAPSAKFVEHAVALAAMRGYRIGNVDITLICEAPKIGPHRDAMRGNVAMLLGVQAEQVNIKATTTEMLGFTGRGEGIAAQAVATLVAN
ncbi:bifunctional 2-C-methyl-D-erythritol 4-phosphate cytidylyltransferase/2-C-methyl-D-erythritol 2,4-cyclodiphosphate synthase [Altererythrobacter sp. KTW20L]|uniref:bifunctional 2-C-methyl-D-erythritol 4-phosphate cytidylyltransferase/2-C-methyl-D-erythritol 2,4-cyclodiphosphate synthase n=1 Tax=Altererythrobacter sp. KTW20L TaxID=2942210 RepID=UPI0020BE2867|nr:bifunctional 2-C-methyl-D-erythritol 4-phosphate cytidylyltransferase/2-C-methyl-D-erythritol 2,4-cyclodiphosphate synthase [Altererythrobacter sp. KTW20L]MCL6251095.1 bifunctional 2-C-methyl-D-erythritol 4-phosphate cytidylyltransferase/2-C-methyl-D-erythritol 2,4-cyclodiphosphate synthase [Altererythrobacter sp. KTW20L]